MYNQEVSPERKPNWLILKEAAQQLVKMGKTVFTRKELTVYARKLDPARSEASLDFEIDLVTVNSNSKDKYRDPDKLFLYRIDRGRYTLYNPEIHGSIDNYIYQRMPPIRRDFINEVVRELESKGYKIEVKQSSKPLTPNIIARYDNEKIGIWLVDPMQDPLSQLKTLAYIVGSAILNKSFAQHIIVLPQPLISRIPLSTREILSKMRIKLAVLKEEKRYTISF